MRCVAWRRWMREFAGDGIDPARADAFAAHLAACPRCAAEWRDLERVGELLAALPQPQPDEAFFSHLAGRIEQRLAPPVAPARPWRLPAAAGALACLLIGLLSLRELPDRTAPVTTQREPTVAPAPAAEPVDEPMAAPAESRAPRAGPAPEPAERPRVRRRTVRRVERAPVRRGRVTAPPRRAEAERVAQAVPEAEAVVGIAAERTAAAPSPPAEVAPPSRPSEPDPLALIGEAGLRRFALVPPDVRTETTVFFSLRAAGEPIGAQADSELAEGALPGASPTAAVGQAPTVELAVVADVIETVRTEAGGGE